MPKAIPNIGKLLPLLDKPVCDGHIFIFFFLASFAFFSPFFKRKTSTFGYSKSSATQEIQSVQ